MKILIINIVLLLTTVMIVNAQQTDFSRLTGPYLGQTLPGMLPEIFAQGIVSKVGIQSKLLITPDGSEIIFKNMVLAGNSPTERKASFISITMKNGIWGLPVNIPFSLEYMNDEPAISPDGKRLFFVSNRPEKENGESQKMPDIWMSIKTSDDWGKPKKLETSVNTDDIEVQPFYSTDDKLYFGRKDGIYYSQYSGGKFNSPVKLSEDIFQGRVRGICISPDNRMLIVHSDKPGGLGNWDLYISFKDKDGKWGALINMGNVINTDQPEANATFSPDGKFIFFSRGDDIYWVSSKISKDLMLKELNSYK